MADAQTTTGADAFRAEAAAYRERADRIRELAEVFASIPGVDAAEINRVAAIAETNNWPLDRVEAGMKIVQRRAYFGGKQAPTQAGLEAALCLACGIPESSLLADRDYGERALEQAWPLRSSGLRGVLCAALEAQGIPAPRGGGQAVFEALLEFEQIRAGGYSNIDLPGLLGNVGNKILLSGFAAVPGVRDVIADQAEFTNFHEHTLYRLDHLGEFAPVPPSGELKHGNLAESEYANKLETRGMLLTLPRQAIVNDDLNAFAGLFKGLVRKALIAVEKALALRVMEAADSFYTTARGNRIVAALSIDGLGQACAAIEAARDAAGELLYLTPKCLLVPPSLKPLADSIYTSTQLNATTSTDADRPADNPHRGRCLPVVCPFLEQAALVGSGASATTWYLLADPLILPAFQVAYLQGRRAPAVESAEAAFDTLGFSVRCVWDFGVARVDHRGAVKSTAA